MRVENNSKFVRGKGKAQEAIEERVLSRFGLEQADSRRGEYVLAIPYETEEELEHIIQEEIWAEAARIADLRNCFIEGDTISLEDPDKYW